MNTEPNNKRTINWRTSSALVALTLFLLAGMFQNCGQGFEVGVNPASQSDELNSDNGGLPPATVPTAKLGLSVTNVTANQGRDFVFTVTLTAPLAEDLVIAYRAVEGDGATLSDYVPTTGTITIAAGDVVASILVPTTTYSYSFAKKRIGLELVATSGAIEETTKGTGEILPSVEKATIKSISFGGTHVCAVLLDGTARCWGTNNVGQLGNNSRNNSAVPVRVLGLTGLKQIAAAGDNSCAVTATDTVKCWGDGGTLGNNSSAPSNVPVDVLGVAGVKSITLATDHACALLNDNTAKCWGSNTAGQLGNGNSSPTAVAVNVVGLSGLKQISAGDGFTCAITATDTVKCWGDNSFRQLGMNTMTPVAGMVDVAGLTGVKALATGGTQGCVIMANNTVRCWGEVITTETPANQGFGPTEIAGLTGVTTISVGSNHACATLDNESIKCWGRNTLGQLGNGLRVDSNLPVTVLGLSGVKRVVAGFGLSCAITNVNTARCWGDNTYGQVGPSPTALSTTLVDMPGLITVKSMAIGVNHSCLITPQDTVRCYGANAEGQLGNATMTPSTLPVDVSGLTTAKAVAVGDKHSCAITPTDTLKCWGANTRGQLGTGNTTRSLTAIDVPGVTGVLSVSLGFEHTCVLTTSGGKCWGSNNSRQVSSLVVATLSPVDIEVPNIKAIAAGLNHTCAITANDTVKCWGNNMGGQLGTGTMVDQPEGPQDTINVAGAKYLAVASYVSCAIVADNRAMCWGANSAATRNPTAMPGFTNMKTIKPSIGFFCGVDLQGKAKCYGRNSVGQLGNGTTNQAASATDMITEQKIIDLQTVDSRTVVLTERLIPRHTGLFKAMSAVAENEIVLPK